MGADDVSPDETRAGPAALHETEAWPQDSADRTAAAAALSPDQESTAEALAYSDTADVPDIEIDTSTFDDDSATPGALPRYALAAMLVLITAGAFVVTAALLMAQLRPRGATSAVQSSTTTAATESPQPELAPPTHDPAWWNAPLEAVAQHQVPRNPDAIFVSDLAAAGFTVSDPTVPISDAHNICKYLGQGHTPAEAAAQNIVIYPGMNATQSSAYVYAAIDAYCPQFQ